MTTPMERKALSIQCQIQHSIEFAERLGGHVARTKLVEAMYKCHDYVSDRWDRSRLMTQIKRLAEDLGYHELVIAITDLGGITAD